MTAWIGNVTSQGQLTIPAKMRKRLNIRPGNRIAWIIKENGQAKLEGKITRQ